MSTDSMAAEGEQGDLATEPEDDLCPHCGLDPYHYEDVGTAFPARVAIVCCEGRRTEMATEKSELVARLRDDRWVGYHPEAAARIEALEADQRRLDWIEKNVSAIRDIGWLNSFDGDLRTAIDRAALPHP